jgi:anti-anti-sigma regulatory factor
MKKTKTTLATDFYIKDNAIVALAVVDPYGKVLDGIISKSAHQALDDAKTAYYSLIIDCSQLKYLTSTSIFHLNRLRRKVQSSGGKYVLCSVPIQINDLFKLIRVDGLYNIADSVEAALAYCNVDPAKHEAMLSTDKAKAPLIPAVETIDDLERLHLQPSVEALECRGLLGTADDFWGIGRCITMVTIDNIWTYGYDATGRLMHVVSDVINPVFPNNVTTYSYNHSGAVTNPGTLDLVPLPDGQIVRRSDPFRAINPFREIISNFTFDVVSLFRSVNIAWVGIDVDAGGCVNEGAQNDDRPGEYSEQGREKWLDALFAVLPDDPKTKLGAVVALQRKFRAKAAEVLQPAVDKLLRSPPESYAEKQTLASEINAAMHQLGLGIAQPKSESPCSVMAQRSPSVEVGWLVLQHRKTPPVGERKQSASTTKLGDLKLVEAVREESLSRLGRTKS